MTSSLDAAQTEQVTSLQNSAPFAGNAITYRIKRSGARPLGFQGTELAMAMSYTPSLPYWYEINIYRTVDQRFALAIRLFFQSEDEQDCAQAWVFDSLEEAFAAIEAYDAAEDVRIPPMPVSASVADLTAYAAELKAQARAARLHYKSLVGEFFHDLEAQD